MVLGINIHLMGARCSNFIRNNAVTIMGYVGIKAIIIYSNLAMRMNYINRNYITPVYVSYLKPIIDNLQLSGHEEIEIINDGEVVDGYYDIGQYNDYKHTLNDSNNMIIIRRSQATQATQGQTQGRVFYNMEDMDIIYNTEFKTVDYTFLLITLIASTNMRYTINIKDTTNFYLDNNELLNYKFLRWYMKTTYGYKLNSGDEYTIKIIDQNANTISLNSKQSIKLLASSYMIINKPDTKKI
jgi:hypothetical protein